MLKCPGGDVEGGGERCLAGSVGGEHNSPSRSSELKPYTGRGAYLKINKNVIKSPGGLGTTEFFYLN